MVADAGDEAQRDVAAPLLGPAGGIEGMHAVPGRDVNRPARRHGRSPGDGLSATASSRTVQTRIYQLQPGLTGHR